MQYLDRLKYTTLYPSFNFPIFDVYKTNVKREKKKRAVVNICKLNDLVIPDAYPLPLQLDIIASVQRCTNIAVLDTITFFYEWLLHPYHWYIFMVVIYQGQETF